MKKYYFNNGQIVNAKDAKHLVEQMNALSFFNFSIDLHEFMKTTAIQCSVQKECEIRTDSFESFVEDLIANKFIEKYEEV